MKRLGFIGLGAMGAPMQAARELYEEGSAQGFGREDDSGVIRLMERNKDRGSDAG